jgi:hypothetical protein
MHEQLVIPGIGWRDQMREDTEKMKEWTET